MFAFVSATIRSTDVKGLYCPPYSTCVPVSFTVRGDGGGVICRESQANGQGGHLCSTGFYVVRGKEMH